MGLIQSGSLKWNYFASGAIRGDCISSGQLQGCHFASGSIIGVSGIVISLNSSGQLVIGFDDKLLKSGK